MNSINGNSSKMYLKVNDIFEDLKEENERLNNELIFAEKCLNRLKSVLIRWHDKYQQVVEEQDKLEFIELTDILNAIDESKERECNFFGIKLSGQTSKNSSSRLKSSPINKIKKKKVFANKLNKKVIKHTDYEPISVEEVGHKNIGTKETSSEDNDDEIESLRQQYIRKENIFDQNTNSYVCPKTDCNKSFQFCQSVDHLRSLYNHLRAVHKMGKVKDNYSEESILTSNSYDSTTKTYRCPKPDCNKEFETRIRIYRHLTIVHSKKPKLVCSVPNCGKLFKNRNNLTSHLKIAHSREEIPKPFACTFDSCQFRCKSKHEIIQHLNSHSDLRLFKCEVSGCDKSFKNARHLKDHSFSHSSEPALKCQFDGCDLLFQTIWHRKTHYSVVHLGKNPNDRPLKHCDWPGCDYKNRFAHQMKKHKLLHTGEKPFHCEWPACGKRFRLKQQLIEHKNIHNNVKPYVCHWPGCIYRSCSSANLRKHVRTSHADCFRGSHVLNLSIDDTSSLKC